MQLCLPIALVLSSAVTGLAGDVALQQIDGLTGTWDGHQELWARPDVTIGQKIEFTVGAILAKHDHGRRLLDLGGLAASVDSAVDYNNAGVTDGKDTGAITKKASAGDLFNKAIVDAHNGDVAEAQDMFSHAKGLASKSLTKTSTAVGHKDDSVQTVRGLSDSSISPKAQDCLTRLADWLDGSEFGDVIHNNHGDAHHMKGEFDTESSFTSSLCSTVSNAADDMADMSKNIFNAGVHFMMGAEVDEAGDLDEVEHPASNAARWGTLAAAAIPAGAFIAVGLRVVSAHIVKAQACPPDAVHEDLLES